MGLTFSNDPELAVRPVNIAFHFTLFVGLETLGDFQAVEGLGFSSPVKQYAEGGRNHSPHLLRWDGPGQRSEVTLRWGMMTRAALYQWSMAVERGYIFRKPVYILQLDRDKAPMRLIALFGAFPVQWRMGALDANSNNWSVEEVVLGYEDIGVIAINESMLDAMGGLVGNWINSGIKLEWSDGESFTLEASTFEEQELEAFSDLQDWEDEQQAMAQLLEDWDNMSEEERQAYMEANGITAEELAAFNEALVAEEGFHSETPSGTALEDVEAALADTTLTGFDEANLGGNLTAAAFDPTAGSLARDPEAEAEEAEAPEGTPRAFAVRNTGGTSLFDEGDEENVPAAFNVEASGGRALADVEEALGDAPLSGFDEESAAGDDEEPPAEEDPSDPSAGA